MNNNNETNVTKESIYDFINGAKLYLENNEFTAIKNAIRTDPEAGFSLKAGVVDTLNDIAFNIDKTKDSLTLSDEEKEQIYGELSTMIKVIASKL
ncbi:hypothetical protein [Vagococcus xieshaowenii]|uniref:Uncharacterized protein n=1 Tax=Vagococcus xieshaowenii TaxID=2562451 RepID=A0AAJ5EH44_9ENTE|nr:hypothetical protein [Vagococcus xieshaowenii]QCA29658.1 hypothetical protein E4Z98_09730 [Vagococcus xieshaowenii]TFZ42931.1 hypothetical protein E4031_01470 [Vagococcus xieshaowenii]